MSLQGIAAASPPVRPQPATEPWTPERDQAFFQIVSGTFPTAFLYGAGVLLGSYDAEP